MLFDGFLNHLDDRVEKYADYKVAFGLLSKNETVDVDLAPIVDAYVDDTVQDVTNRSNDNTLLTQLSPAFRSL